MHFKRAVAYLQEIDSSTCEVGTMSTSSHDAIFWKQLPSNITSVFIKHISYKS